MESVQTKNQVEYTDDEKRLAERYRVEPKTVRLISEIVGEHTSEIAELVNLIRGEKEQETEPDETDIVQINQILRSWPKERVSFLAESLGVLQEAKEQAEPEKVEGTKTEGPETDKESEHLKERLQNNIADVLKPLNCYTANFRKEVLTAALEQVSKTTEPTEKLAEIEQEIRRACESLLDAKAKACIAVLSELMSVGGVTSVDYGTDILCNAYQGKSLVDDARKQFTDDSNLSFLSYVFDLAHCINEAEGKIFQQETTAEEETAEQPQATEPEDAEAGPNTGIKALDDFLETLSYEAKATAYGALRLVCVSDATGKKMSDYLRRQVALLEDPEQVNDLMIDGQVLADIRWFLGFVRGAEIGLEEC